MNRRQRWALRIAGREGEVCSMDVQARFKVSQPQARRDLLDLVATGVLKKYGRGQGTCYRLAGMKLREETEEGVV
ncbi:hypothetical protein ES708_23595 [subsurface metagenome]